MNVENRHRPDPEQMAALMAATPDGPVVMVNLLRFRERARYADGRDAHLTGLAAYQRYSMGVMPLILESGGRVLYAGQASAVVVGQVEEPWHQVALALYPSRAAFQAMTSSPAYLAIAEHREAGLEGQLLIATSPAFLPAAAPLA